MLAQSPLQNAEPLHVEAQQATLSQDANSHKTPWPMRLGLCLGGLMLLGVSAWAVLPLASSANSPSHTAHAPTVAFSPSMISPVLARPQGLRPAMQQPRSGLAPPSMLSKGGAGAGRLRAKPSSNDKLRQPPPFLARPRASLQYTRMEAGAATANVAEPVPPPVSPATNLPNQIYEWRGQQIRWQMAGDPTAKKSVVLVHGLFVNADHWRYTLKGLAEAGYRAYALDLLGSGYSSKPAPWDEEANKMVNGERNRFTEDAEMIDGVKERTKGPSILKNMTLGTADGGERVGRDVDLRHPLGSPYNFFTWGEQIADFTKDVIQQNKAGEKTTVVCNSIGTMSSLQAVLDEPQTFDGCFVIAPNFRELHSAEIPFAEVSMPILRSVQKLLRSKGQGLFDKLAKPDIVKQILMEPYAVTSAVDDELVDVLLTPLLTKGASDVVFDTLSYSAGPLPEQQLSDPSFPVADVPVWICYGDKDPWTPGKRVDKLGDLPSVEKVVVFKDVGHCPHDEAPEVVNPLLLQFLDRLSQNNENRLLDFLDGK